MKPCLFWKSYASCFYTIGLIHVRIELRFLLMLVTFGAYFYTYYTNRRCKYARKMYQITHRDQNDTQNAMKIHNDWLRPARHLNRCCIENKIIITKKNAHRICTAKLHILKLISGQELFPFTDQLKEFSTTFREIDVHKSTDLSHYRYLNLLSRNKSIKSVFWPINVAAQITTGCNSIS